MISLKECRVSFEKEIWECQNLKGYGPRECSKILLIRANLSSDHVSRSSYSSFCFSPNRPEVIKGGYKGYVPRYETVEGGREEKRGEIKSKEHTFY